MREVHRAIWCVGPGEGTAQHTRGPPCPGCGGLALPRTARQPPLQLWRLAAAAADGESAILSEHLFRCLPAGCRTLSCPGLASMQRGAGWAGCWACLPLARWAPSLCEQMHWNVWGEGARGRRRWTREMAPPPAPGVARDRDRLCFPLAPGKVPGRPVPQPFLSYCQMVKGGGVPRRAGRRRGVCVCGGEGPA